MAQLTTNLLCRLPKLYIALLFYTSGTLRSEESEGKAIYQKLCSECHGERGQGVEGKYDDPLTGEKSLDALARQIERTMPEDEPELCVGKDAQKVAKYIYDSFYSPEAQARRDPPRIELTRLTEEQIRNHFMDLVGHFHQGVGYDRPIAGEKGLKGSYRGFSPLKPNDKLPKGIASKRSKGREKQGFDRVDPQIRFHFGKDSPEPGKMGADEFRLQWDGAIHARETGIYEFIVKTENGFRLWVNADSGDEGSALIDGWVSAGPEVRTEKKPLFLLGGRSYRLTLEHFKFQEKTSSIELWWKPPHGKEELIPSDVLSSERPRVQCVVTTAFPPDDSSAGYARGSTLSKAWQQAVMDAAIETVEHVIKRINELAGTRDGAADRVDKLQKFAERWVMLCTRAPITAETRQLYLESPRQGTKSPEVALKRILLLSLQSPTFLYPSLQLSSQPKSLSMAQQLALTLWDSLPDRKLLQAAEKNQLQTPSQVQNEAKRMLQDPRTRAKMHGFFYHWLELERAEGTRKDPKAFPAFTPPLWADLRRSLFLFIDDVVWSPSSDYRRLLQADYLLLNEPLAAFYGKNVQGSDFQKVQFDPKQRAGVVTHPYLLASLAYSKQSSPIHRGVFLTRNIVGMSLKPPQKAVVFEESHFNPKLTMRQKVTELTRSDACMSCHRMINPLGFSLENFDAVGRWRTKDNQQPINTKGELHTDDGHTVQLNGPRDIVNFVVSNPSGHRAFIRHLFHHMVKQEPTAYGLKTLDTLQKRFAENQCNIQKLMMDIAVTSLHPLQTSTSP